MPFFSVVIPLFNKENHIYDTLTYILNQTFPDFEVIVVNDGSTDNSSNIVENFSDSRIRLFHQENQGASVARNFGISRAQSKYIALIDADDIWYSTHLEEFTRVFKHILTLRFFVMLIN
ncbi:glycosyltransferase family 2 protein [Mesonia maritima]|uniref:glycosyltransferase family 2 protein n=1 Tax=Mesonia maritima TaxID=1793873 RepID=UPI0036354C69